VPPIRTLLSSDDRYTIWLYKTSFCRARMRVCVMRSHTRKGSDSRRSALTLTHAKLKDRRIRKLATLKKLYNYPGKASARPYLAQHPERSRIVAVRLPVVGALLASLPRHHQLHRVAVAAKSLHANGLSENTCRIGV
jgi:hypothetical protein